MHQIESGYIYILSSTHHKGLFKIGRTTKDPSIRANDLSKQTGAIGNFEVEWHIKVPDIEVAEKMCHYLFKHLHDSKEYYAVDIDEAISVIEDKLTAFFDLKNASIFIKQEHLIKRKLKSAKEKLDKALNTDVK